MINRTPGRLIALVAILAVCCSALIAAQEAGQLRLLIDKADQDISRALMIKYKDAHLVNAAIDNDRPILMKSAGAAKLVFVKNGYKDDADEAVIWAWKSLRLSEAKSLSATLSYMEIQTRASELGKITVSSTPPSATIIVDDSNWATSTDTELYAKVGQRTIKVQLTGHQPTQAVCDVKRGQIAAFVAALAPSGSTATCK